MTTTDYRALLHAATVLEATARDFDRRLLEGAPLLRCKAQKLQEVALREIDCAGYYDVFNAVVYCRVEPALEALRGGNPIIPIPCDLMVSE